MSSSICVESGCRCAIRTVELNRLFVGEEEIVARGIRNCGVWLGREKNVKLVYSRLEIQCSFGIPYILSK